VVEAAWSVSSRVIVAAIVESWWGAMVGLAVALDGAFLVAGLVVVAAVSVAALLLAVAALTSTGLARVLVPLVGAGAWSGCSQGKPETRHGPILTEERGWSATGRVLRILVGEGAVERGDRGVLAGVLAGLDIELGGDLGHRGALGA